VEFNGGVCGGVLQKLHDGLLLESDPSTSHN